MANFLKIGSGLQLLPIATGSAPASPAAGLIYYDSTLGQLRFAQTAGSYVNVMQNPMTTSQDIIVGGASGAATRLGIGASNTVLRESGGSLGYGLLVNANIDAAAAIAYSKLNLSGSIVNADVNAAAAIAYSKLSLSDSIVNADINSAAAIAYSKLNLSASIVNADIAAAAAIALNKLAAVTASRLLVSDASGFVSASSVTSTEAGYLSGVTSAIQTQLDAKVDDSEKGAAGGVATLDGGGKIPASQLPNSVMEFQGAWNASTNSPALADGTGNAGDVYRVSVAGTQNLGSGSQTFAVGDWVMYSGTIWQKSPATDAVTSVNGYTGAVTLVTDDIAEDGSPVNLWFTDERAQDAVGGMVANSSKVSLTYVDAAPSLTADIIAGSLVNADINASAAIAYSKLAALTASRALASDASGFVSASAVTSTELGYLSGVTSAIQTQLDGKANTALSNLSSVAINTSLISDTDNTDDLGSAAINWKDVHAKSLKSSDGLALQSNDSNAIQAQGGKWRRSKAASTSRYVEEEYVDSIALTASTTAVASDFTFDTKTIKALKVEYTILEATTNRRRVGTLLVVGNGAAAAASTVLSITDFSTESDDVGVVWTAAMNVDNCELSYTTSANAKTMRADIKRFLA